MRATYQGLSRIGADFAATVIGVNTAINGRITDGFVYAGNSVYRTDSLGLSTSGTGWMLLATVYEQNQALIHYISKVGNALQSAVTPTTVDNRMTGTISEVRVGHGSATTEDRHARGHGREEIRRCAVSAP